MPPHVAATVLKTIEKLPADRFETAAQFMEAPDDSSFTYTPTPRPESTRPAVAPLPAAPARPKALAALGAALVLTLAIGAWGWLRPGPAPPTRWFHVLLDSLGNDFGPLADLSPDGSRVAYVGADGRLWVRNLSAPDARPIIGTEGARTPFFSPDGRSVGFHRGSRTGGLSLWTVALDGAPPIQVVGPAQSSVYPGGTWTADGFIYYTNLTRELWRVPADGGTPELMADTTQGHFAWPEAVPGGGGVLVSVEGSFTGLSLFSPGNRKVEPLLPELSGDQRPEFGRYVDGHLVWVNAGRTLMAARFDLGSLKVLGKPVAIAPSIMAAGAGTYDFAAGGGGALLYASNVDASGSSLGEGVGWVSRSGTASVLDPQLASDAGDFDFLRLSLTVGTSPPRSRWERTARRTNSTRSVSTICSSARSRA